MAIQTFIIDNFDSFTFNLVDLVAGINHTAPTVIKNNQLSVGGLLALPYDNLIISPGPGTVAAARDIGICLDVIAQNKKPLLGVCLGHQAIAYHFGGRGPGIIDVGQPIHGKATKIFHNGKGLFAGVPNPFLAGRYHSLVVREETLSPDIEITARDEAGNIMGLAHRHRPIYGVQFHPESILTPDGKKILENFFALAESFMDKNTTAKKHHHLATAPAPLKTKKTNQAKKIWCEELPYMLDNDKSPHIFTHCFLPHGNAIWLEGDEKTGWGRQGFSYMAMAESTPSGKHMARPSILTVDRFSGDDDFFAQLARVAQDFSFDDEATSDLPETLIKNLDTIFLGGAMGFLAYEGRVLCPDAFHAPYPPHDSQKTSLPDGFFIIARRLLVQDKINGKTYLLAIDDAGDGDEGMNNAKQWFASVKATIDTIPQQKLQTMAAAPGHQLSWAFDKSKDLYIKNVKESIAAIKRGEVYQLCLTNQLTATLPMQSTTPAPFDIYCHLRQDNHTPYRGFLSINLSAVNNQSPSTGGASQDKPTCQAALLCFSPEEFLQINQHKKIITKPIKGTIRRDSDAATDKALAEQLLASEKNRAENVMIIDLLRNDLTRVATLGSIKVEKNCALESFDRVHQLVSTITADLADDKNIADLLMASFPGGSMTGAPKIRAMELLAKMEDRPRGIYAGAFGYIGNITNLAMVIRSLIVEEIKNTYHYSLSVGGGIVVDSKPEEEWQELLWKSSAIIESLKKIMTVNIKE